MVLGFGYSLTSGIQESFFIANPKLTEKNLVDQSGRVLLVTGGYAGVGLELVKILYQHNATIYIAGRSKDKANEAIDKLKSAYPESKGKLEFLSIDLSDFKTIKPAADEFISKETRLDVLINNAGVMFPPNGSVDSQGYELQLGTNCLGPFIFVQHLLPILQSTAKISPPDSVRVTWASSIMASVSSPNNGVEFVKNQENQENHVKYPLGQAKDYGQSKAGNTLLASEFAKRHGQDGIISVSFNPGNLKTGLLRHIPWFVEKTWQYIMHEPIYGGYTELYAACSDEITKEHNGCYISPWGRISKPRNDVYNSMKRVEEGGSGVGENFWKWCENETKKYL